MEKRKKTARLCHNLSMICFLISSCVVFLIPLADKYAGTVMDYLPGILFWTAILLGIILYIMSYRLIKDAKGFQMLRSVERPGALAPGSIPEGLAADILFVPACVITMLGTFVMAIPGWIMIISMWITILSFYGHLILNGKIYKFLHIKRVLQTKEKAENKQEALQHAKEYKK